MKQIFFSALIVAGLVANISAASEEAQILAHVTRDELARIEHQANVARIILNGAVALAASTTGYIGYQLGKYGLQLKASAFEQAALSQPYLSLAVRSTLALSAGCWLLYSTGKILLDNRVNKAVDQSFEKDRIKLLEEQFEQALSTKTQEPTVVLDEHGLEICEINK